jgi:hypothetical protein
MVAQSNGKATALANPHCAMSQRRVFDIHHFLGYRYGDCG